MPGLTWLTWSLSALMRTSAAKSWATCGSLVPSLTASSAARTWRWPHHDSGQTAFSALVHARCSCATFSWATPAL